MKITVEIDRKELAFLVDALKDVLKDKLPASTISRIAEFVEEKDLDLRILEGLKIRLKGRINSNVPFEPKSELRDDLAMNEDFITKSGGLNQISNNLLIDLLKEDYPECKARVKGVLVSELAKVLLVSEVQSLIKGKYDAAKVKC